MILSDVLLDNWQINNLETRFIGAERTRRLGGNYYLSFQEQDPKSKTESFGIYGHQFRCYGRACVGLYGNRRLERNFLTLKETNLVDLFGMEAGVPIDKYKGTILAEFLRYAASVDKPLRANIRDGFQALDWLDGERVKIPILYAADNEALSDLAEGFTDDLITALEQFRGELEKAYRYSIYNQEITFGEYTIWWSLLLYFGDRFTGRSGYSANTGIRHCDLHNEVTAVVG